MAFVYILTNNKSTPLYIGVTNNLRRRILEYRKSDIENSYTAKYKLYKLVYFEELNTIVDAIEREKRLKNWKRVWKLDLIKKINPRMDDLCKWI